MEEVENTLEETTEAQGWERGGQVKVGRKRKTNKIVFQKSTRQTKGKNSIGKKKQDKRDRLEGKPEKVTEKAKRGENPRRRRKQRR